MRLFLINADDRPPGRRHGRAALRRGRRDLVRRGSTSYVNEPHPNGGSPILSSKDGIMFNDILGTTTGTEGKDGYANASLTAFGDSAPGGSRSVATDALFTGKPHVDGLGYAFLFRNYRPGLGKWQTADPLGYPDGWNQLAYGQTAPVEGFDWQGSKWKTYTFSMFYDVQFEPLIVIPDLSSLPFDTLGQLHSALSNIWSYSITSIGVSLAMDSIQNQTLRTIIDSLLISRPTADEAKETFHEKRISHTTCRVVSMELLSLDVSDEVVYATGANVIYGVRQLWNIHMLYE